MQNIKSWKSFDEQLELLKSRGLIVTDEKIAIFYLKNISYYRLSGYLYSFKDIENIEFFYKNSHFEDVKKLYIFDKKLRLLALDALERIEVALRVDITYLLGSKDNLAHKKSKYFVNADDHKKWLEKYLKLERREQSKKTDLVTHNLNKYGDLPIWASSEIWDFGTMSMLFKNMKIEDKDKIAHKYDLKSGAHLESHLQGLNFIRNVSAHHGRLWNRKIIGRASVKGLPDPLWKDLSPDRPFLYFCLMRRMLLKISPTSTWHHRFKSLLNEFPDIDIENVNLKNFGLVIDIDSWKLWSS